MSSVSTGTDWKRQGLKGEINLTRFTGEETETWQLFNILFSFTHVSLRILLFFVHQSDLFLGENFAKRII